jgi:putative NIF3 family GTP cyclohydrolase 1 type 2
MLVVYTVEVVYATLEVLDAAAELELELVLVTTPLALEELDADEELEELLEVVVVAAAVDEAELE